MKCFSRGLKSTSRGSSRDELVASKPPRVNGWSWPPHPFQVLAVLLYGYVCVVSFGIFIPLLPLPWNYAAYTLTALVFVVFFFAHIAAVTVDPADPSVRAKQGYSNPMPLFDRTTQEHVIQDLHCYLCDVMVGPKVKHCGVCNKCVEDFDHHCKWLNNCVGGRNYWFFFVALSSATLAALLLLVVILFIIIQHYLDPSSLRTAPQFGSVQRNGTWLAFLPVAPIKTSSAGLLILAFITVVMSLIALLLLGPLLLFHFYLFFKGISTIDYIKMKQAARNRDSANQKRSIDCEPALSQRSSTSQFDSKGPLRNRLFNSISTEKSSAKENSFHYVTENPTEHATSEGSDTKSWMPDTEEGAQSGAVKSGPCSRSAEPPGCLSNDSG
ncbi:palmitoyltransferase ZDHHC11 [Brachionichthys hirsutus]|uniref:palmitoyltransferase ZDHHC11 n=1 Tax=Brachionichthys hirsutus TaxID=412623 RepID=UPI0036052DBB